MREVLRVPGLVQEHAVVVLTAGGQDHEIDLVRDAHGSTEGARRLELADLGVEVHVGLGVEIDAHAGQGAAQRRDERLAFEDAVEALGAPQRGEVGEVELREGHAEAFADEAVHDPLVEAVGVGEKPLEFGAEVVVVEAAYRAVELLVVGIAKLQREVVTAPPERVEQRVEVLRRGREARRLDAGAARPVGLVGLDHARLAQPEGLTVDGDRGLALGVGDLVAEVLGLLAHEAVHSEGQQVGEAQLFVVGRGGVQLLEAVDGLPGEELRVAVVHGGGIAPGLAPGEVLVVLEVERADELLGAPAVPLQIEVAHGVTPFRGPGAWPDGPRPTLPAVGGPNTPWGRRPGGRSPRPLTVA